MEGTSNAGAPGDAGAPGGEEPPASACGAAARLTSPDLATSTVDAAEGAGNASSSRDAGAGVKGCGGGDDGVISGGGNGGGRAGLEESAAREGARLHAYQARQSVWDVANGGRV